MEASAQSWIHYLGTRAFESGKLIFNVDANYGDERIGKVIVKDKAGKADPVTLTFFQEKKEIPVTSIELDQTEVVLDTGVYHNLSATVKPDDATYKTVTWESDNTDVATVDYKGTVRTVNVGTAIITAKAQDYSATCTVTVIDKEKKIKAALMKIYDALDGPNWKNTAKWDKSKPLEDWEGVYWHKRNDELHLILRGSSALRESFLTALTSCPRLFHSPFRMNPV